MEIGQIAEILGTIGVLPSIPYSKSFIQKAQNTYDKGKEWYGERLYQHEIGIREKYDKE